MQDDRSSVLEPADDQGTCPFPCFAFQPQPSGQLSLPSFESFDVLLELAINKIAAAAESRTLGRVLDDEL